MRSLARRMVTTLALLALVLGASTASGKDLAKAYPGKMG